jgi:hypothetical protein
MALRAISLKDRGRRPERGGGGGWTGAESDSFARTDLCPKFNCQSQNTAIRWWTYQPTMYKWSPRSYKHNRKRMGSIGHPVSKIWPKRWMDVGLKISVGHCPVELKTKGRILSGSRWTLSDRRSLENVIFSKNLPLSSQVWFLSCNALNQMKLGHKGHLNTMNKFPKEVFPKSNNFPFDGWTQKPRFWGNQDKFMKSKGLETWIYSKVGDR